MDNVKSHPGMMEDPAGLETVSKKIAFCGRFSAMQGLPDPRCSGRPDRTPGKINNIVADQTVRCRIPTRICRKCNGIGGQSLSERQKNPRPSSGKPLMSILHKLPCQHKELSMQGSSLYGYDFLIVAILVCVLLTSPEISLSFPTSEEIYGRRPSLGLGRHIQRQSFGVQCGPRRDGYFRTGRYPLMGLQSLVESSGNTSIPCRRNSKSSEMFVERDRCWRLNWSRTVKPKNRPRIKQSRL